MLKSLKSPKGQIFVTVVASIVMIVLWLSYDLPIAILPALFVPMWIPIFSMSGEPASASSRRNLFLSLAIGVFVLAMGIGVFVVES